MDRSVSEPRIVQIDSRKRIGDAKQAREELPNDAYVAFCVVKGMQQTIALLVKRFPELAPSTKERG